jgi:site-specific recombinase XerC
MKLSEIASLQVSSIDWTNNTVIIWGKGNVERKAVFTQRSARLLKGWLRTYKGNGMVWNIDYRGI